MSALRLITFDVTGTLLKLHPTPATVFSQNAKSFDINVPPEVIATQFKTAMKKLSSEHPNFGSGHSGIGWHEWWTLLVKNTFTGADPTLSFDDQRLDSLADHLINEYKTRRCWSLAEGATDFLHDLRTANIPIGVISNYDPRLDTVLEATSIRQYFKFVISSYSAGVMKPDKKIFKMAESQIPSIKPSNCLHVGDNFDVDFMGAQIAGWSAALINSQATDDSHYSQRNIFPSLSNLNRKLKENQFKNLQSEVVM